MSDVLFQPLGKSIAIGEGLAAIADIDPRLIRTHYFDGRLLTAEDLTRDQIYVDQRLRELGRVLGTGIMSGLELSFDRYTGKLSLQPGQALTPAGRVLEVGTPLEVDLNDRALIASLNNNSQFRLNRALYAVVLNYVEVGTDIEEVFPKDLGAKRGFQYALITESVQMGLVPLPLPLPQQDPLHIRSRLMTDLIGSDQFNSLLPEDGVALGVLAIQDDTPQWLDQELLRHPLRSEPRLGDLQSDLSRQYEQLLSDILVQRRSGNLGGDFAASDYFSLLPPVGTVPKDAIDPVNGRQGYFPENYQVTIAPVRMSDVALLKAESLSLPPINLNSKEPVDVMILVPMSNQDYGYYASQLERGYDDTTRRLPQLDLLRLKLYPVRPVHTIPTDASAWDDIWNRLAETPPFYVRRPSRAAETAISGIVLALDTEVPEPEAISISTVTDEGGLIQSEDDLFLKKMNIALLANLRPPQNSDGQNALNSLTADYAENAAVAQQISIIIMRIEREYDTLLWQTLLSLAEGNMLEQFITELVSVDPSIITPSAVVEVGNSVGMDPALITLWADMVP